MVVIYLKIFFSPFFRYDYSLLRQKIDPTHWESHSTVALVNAFYNPSINSMEFPAGILQVNIFFKKNRNIIYLFCVKLF